MPTTDTSWSQQVRDAIEELVGAPTTADLDRRWTELAQRNTVAVTVVGPFNSGKSSLIRRLLIDAGTDVPSWLTVHARPETTQVRTVASGAMTFVDTPGLHSGNAEHDGLAEEALVDADAVVVMIPPQVVKQYVSWIRSVCDGTQWVGRGAALFAAGSLLVVIGRGDAFGLNPPDSPQEYRDLCAGKLSELERALDLPASAPRPVLLMVAQDPYAATAEDPRPQREDYDGGRDWDGMSALQEQLDGLPGRLSELRAAAEIRYWASSARDVLAVGRAEAEALRGLVAEAELAEKRLAQSRASLAAVDRAARGDLVARLESELSAASARSLAHGTGPGERLESVVTDWAKEHQQRVAEVARTVDRELDARRNALSVRALDAWISKVTGQDDGASGTDDDPRLVLMLKQISPHTKELVDAHYSLRIGMTRKTAEELISAFDKAAKAGEGAVEGAKRLGEVATTPTGTDSLKPLARLRAVLARRGTLDSPEQVERARTLLRRSDVAAQFFTVLGVVGPPVMDLISDHQAARKQEKARAARVAEGRALVGKIVPEVLGSAERPRTGWAGLIADLQDALTTDPRTAAATRTTAERLAEVDRCCAELTRLLDATPSAQPVR